MGALAVLAGGVAVSSRMNAAWQMVLIWGVLVGGATGATSIDARRRRREPLVLPAPRFGDGHSDRELGDGNCVSCL